jgi:hypothetical protein
MSTIDVAKLFICEFFHLQGLPKQIIGDWDWKFVNQFQGTLLKMLGIRLKVSSAYQLETDAQIRRLTLFWKIC